MEGDRLLTLLVPGTRVDDQIDLLVRCSQLAEGEVVRVRVTLGHHLGPPCHQPTGEAVQIDRDVRLTRHGDRDVADAGVVAVTVTGVEGHDHIRAEGLDRRRTRSATAAGSATTRVAGPASPVMPESPKPRTSTRLTPSAAAAAYSSSSRCSPMPPAGRSSRSGHSPASPRVAHEAEARVTAIGALATEGNRFPERNHISALGLPLALEQETAVLRGPAGRRTGRLVEGHPGSRRLGRRRLAAVGRTAGA